MKWEEMQEKARLMGAAEIDAALLALASDERFPAVLRLIDRQREAFVDGGCQQAMAADPGKQTHCWGSVYALRELEGELRQRMEPGRKG